MLAGASGPMLPPLTRLSALPGCRGAALVADGQVLGARWSRAESPGALEHVGATLARLGEMAARAGYPRADVVARFAAGVLVCHPVGDGAWLVLLCDDDAPLAVVALEATAEAPALATFATPPPTAPPPTPPPTGRHEAERVLADRLPVLRDLLVHHVGPMGRLLLDRHLDAWSAQGPATASRLSDLATRLAAEIDDAADRAAFHRHPVWHSSWRP